MKPHPSPGTDAFAFSNSDPHFRHKILSTRDLTRIYFDPVTPYNTSNMTPITCWTAYSMRAFRAFLLCGCTLTGCLLGLGRGDLSAQFRLLGRVPRATHETGCWIGCSVMAVASKISGRMLWRSPFASESLEGQAESAGSRSNHQIQAMPGYAFLLCVSPGPARLI